MYDFRLDEVAEWIAKKNARVVALQMPEGLKVYCQKILEDLEAKTKVKCIIMADSCYGACDLSSDFDKFADCPCSFWSCRDSKHACEGEHSIRRS